MKKSKHSFEIAFCESIIQRDPQYLEVLEMLANFYTEAGHIAEGLEVDEKIVRLAPANPTAHYNLACSLALSNRLEEAVGCLRTALNKGYNEFDWMLKDPDLRILHHDPHFRNLLSEFKIEQH